MKIKSLYFRCLHGICGLLAATLAVAAPEPGVVIGSVSTDPASGMVTVSGTIDAEAQVVAMDINGYSPALGDFQGEAFTVTLPKAESYQFNLYDASTNYSTVTYAAPGTDLSGTTMVIVNDEFLDELGPVLGRLLANLDLNDVLNIDPNQCVIDTWFLIGCDFYLKELAIIGTPEIEVFMTPTDGEGAGGSIEELTINVNLYIPESKIKTKIKKSYWWGYHKTTITTRDIDVGFQIAVSATDDRSIRLGLDEPSDVQLHIGDMDVSSSSLAAHLIPLFKDSVADLINGHLVNAAGPLLSSLPIPSIPLSLPLDIDGDGTTDADFALNLGVESLDVFDSGDGLAILGGSVSANNVAPGREVLGSRQQHPGVQFNNFPFFIQFFQGLDQPTDLIIVVMVDFVNQVMMSLYQTGIEEKIVLPLKVSDLGFLGAGLSLYGYGPDAPVNVRMSFGGVPEVFVDRESENIGADLEAFLPQVRIQMTSPDADGVEEVLIDFTSDLTIDTFIATEEDGRLHIDFDNLLDLQITDINGGLLANELPPEQMKAIIAFAIPPLLADLEPMVDELTNSGRLELDIGHVMSDWLAADFPSVPVEAYFTHVRAQGPDQAIDLGVGLDFPE